CYKPKTKATRGHFLHQSANSMLSYAFDRQDEQFQRAFDVLRAGMAQRAFPGASLAIAHQGKLVALKGLGRFTYAPESPEVAPQTLYAPAPATRVAAPIVACVLLSQRGDFNLALPLFVALPPSAPDHPRRTLVTLRMLLAHSSGLPAYI